MPAEGAPPAGALLVDKPAGLTSHDVVARVRRAYGVRQVGHTGTLDPFATGLLVVLVGRPTRLARFVEAQAKTYLATARLGVATETDDLTGTPVGEEVAVTVGESEVRAALEGLGGAQAQRPPAYSAKRVAGERSYRLARRGQAVALADVTVTVHDITLVSYQPPLATFRTTVSAGTYVRALARDLGERLGTGAHLTALRRESIGGLRVEDAVTLDDLGPAAPLRPAGEVLAHLPRVELDAEGRRAVAHGRTVRDPSAADGTVTLLFEGALAAVGEAESGEIRPVVVLAEP